MKTLALGALFLAISAAVIGPAHAQQWQQESQPPAASYPPGQYPPANQYPPPNTYPAPNAYPPPAPQQKAHPVRDLFVGTLSAIIQAATGGAVTSITQGVTGSITNWFDRKARKGQQQYAQSYYPPAGTTDPYATASQYPPPTTSYPQAQAPYPQDPAQQYPQAQYPQGQATYPQGQSQYPQDQAQYPSATYPATTTYPSYPADPNAASAYQNTPMQVYDPSTGQLVDASGSVYAGASGSGYDSSTLYAGFAYEVHAVGQGSFSTPINAATHQFRSGDRFMVHFRPSMPGRLDVYNINPFGQQTRIDSVEVAAGQLTSLGPYEFAGTKGNESLRLVLAPCSTPQLLTQTRDIVNVSQSAGGGVALSSCGLATRSVAQVRTRDIQKVAVDGGTSYALDPVSPTELSSGELAAREVTIVFHHN